MVVGWLLPMATRARYQNRIELLQGTLDMLVLRTLQWGPQHGHGIGVAISNLSQDALQIDHGPLYPALQRLERRGWSDACGELSENRQRAKYYRLTPTGQTLLVAAEARGSRLVEAIARATH